MTDQQTSPVLVCGGGIGGLAAALALVRQGFDVSLFEQSPRLGEIDAGIQIGPNAFHALEALGVGDKCRSRAVLIDQLVMHDALDSCQIARIETGEAFRTRFGNPYAVIHRSDIHQSLLEAAVKSGRIKFIPDTRIEKIRQDADRVTVADQHGNSYQGVALVGADGGKSVVRAQYVNDPPRVTGHVINRAVVNEAEFPENLRWNAASLWAGPHCHLMHYPLRGGKQYNIVATFHSRNKEEWGVSDGSQQEVENYFRDICPQARQLIDLPKTWQRWVIADREPIPQWSFGRVTLLGDAAHPTTQYLAQGACMALEDAVTLGEALRASARNWIRALDLYQRSRIVRTGRIVLSSREMGHLYHAKGVERLIRNALWQGRTQERYHDAVEWLYGWNVGNCLASD